MTSMRAGAMGRTNASSVGMMDGAFFVSRGELLAWVNGLLHVNLQKVEQCASGAIYCQIIDACHPSTVAMRKVNWMARADHEYIPNYKILQAAFDRNSVEKHIDVDKLIRAKYQDNLEFLQWMKCYWEREGPLAGGYDPVSAREGRPLPPWAKAPAFPSPGNVTAAGKENLHPPTASTADGKAGSGRSPAAAVGRHAPGQQSLGARRAASAQKSAAAEEAARTAEAARQHDDLTERFSAQQEELLELRGSCDGLEKERDYYFRKLRRVEILCETLKARPDEDPPLSPGRILADVQGILYAEDEEEEEENDPLRSHGSGEEAVPA